MASKNCSSVNSVSFPNKHLKAAKKHQIENCKFEPTGKLNIDKYLDI